MSYAKFRRAYRRGFSLVEVSVVSGLLVALAMLLADAWSAFGSPLVETAFRCRLDQEAHMALASLARDLGGSLGDTTGRTGSKLASQFVGWTEPGGSQLWLCFDSPTNPNGLADWAAPDTVVSYQIDGNSLTRWNQLTGTTFVVAGNVTQLQAQDLGGSVEIWLTFQYRDISQTYTLIANSP
jgi:prepilin-type N-terminal cleavage/methylation domain-containing protein